MKKAIAALIAFLFFLMFVNILNSDSEEFKGIPKFGEVNLTERVSNKYISKSVSGDSGEIVYGKTENAELLVKSQFFFLLQQELPFS